jgi:CTP synthase (UTP-ammonia lyase)
MKSKVSLAIIGEYDAGKVSHPATLEAVRHASEFLGIKTEISWVSTLSCLTEAGLGKLADFDCIWASSGSPYQSTEGMLRGIRRVRESNKPFIGT